MISLICGIFKNGTNEPIYKTEEKLQMKKIILWLLREREAGINWEIGIDIDMLLIAYGEPCQMHDLQRRFSFGTRDQA